MTIWTSTNVAAALGASASGSWHAAHVAIDSRQVHAGNLYVALKGERVDGHAYIAEALREGAVAAVSEYVPDGVDARHVVVVPNTYRALEQLGAYARARFKGRVVGLTGSVGKTTTKDMLRLVLGAYDETFASFGNFNNHIGTPLNLANLPEDAVYGVFEMGMNHAGEIAALAQQVRPHVAIITNVEAVHLEFFKNVEAIADAKAEIFDGLHAGGVAILNRDNAQFERLAAHTQARVISVGFSEAATVRAREVTYQEKGMQIAADVAGERVSYRLQALGEPAVMASLLALATVAALQLPLPPALTALAEFTETAGRGSVQRVKDFWLLDDAYNASPASMTAAFKKMALLRKVTPQMGRLVAVLGDMLELGESENALHAALAGPIQAAGIDLVITAGTRMEHLQATLPTALRGGHFPSADALKPELLTHLRPDDLVLIKGSHGSKMYALAAALHQVG